MVQLHSEALVGNRLADHVFTVQNTKDAVTQHLIHLLRLKQEDDVFLQVLDEVQLQLPNKTREVWLVEDPAAKPGEVGQEGTADLLFVAVELGKTVAHDGSQRLHHVVSAELGSGAVDFGKEAETLVRRQLRDALRDAELVEEMNYFFDVLGIVAVNATCIAVILAALEFDHGEISALCLSALCLCRSSASCTLGWGAEKSSAKYSLFAARTER